MIPFLEKKLTIVEDPKKREEIICTKKDAESILESIIQSQNTQNIARKNTYSPKNKNEKVPTSILLPNLNDNELNLNPKKNDDKVIDFCLFTENKNLKRERALSCEGEFVEFDLEVGTSFETKDPKYKTAKPSSYLKPDLNDEQMSDSKMIFYRNNKDKITVTEFRNDWDM